MTSTSVSDKEDPELDILAYHQRTKHRLDGYAKGPETIDWDMQPDPFRRFEGATIVKLPLQTFAKTDDVWFKDDDLNTLLQPAGKCQQVNLETIGVWLQHSLALSAWKQYGDSRWSLRCNPSSGNLHPTEAYLISLATEGLTDGVYHYRADLHALEQRCIFTETVAVESPQLLIGLSSVHWREAWKYGERAYRYSQLDIGHAVAALAYAGSLNGWTLTNTEAPHHTELTALLGLDRVDDFVQGEEEWADALFQVGSRSSQQSTVDLGRLLELAANGRWSGKASVLDKRHLYEWPVIDRVANLSMRLPVPKPSAKSSEIVGQSWPSALKGEYRDSLSRVIRQRRSAQAFDGYTSMSQQQFYVVLDHLLPRPELTPWSALPEKQSIHLVFYVHRVEGLAPGLYSLSRSSTGEDLLRKELRDQFAWQPVEGAPEHLPFYQLVLAKAGKTAAKLSCQQNIAGDSAFSLTMLGEFESELEKASWHYPELYWEAGVIGQVLYLEAEAIGLSGTGIGCYFDDAVHELLGIDSLSLQSLYHFTVGGALKDNRIITLPPYSSAG